MRKNLAKHTAKKLPLAKRVLALCFALIFVCSCLLPAFANGTGEGLDTPGTEVVEAADPGTEPESMDLYDEPAAMDNEPAAVADEPAALDDDFAVADEPAAMDDDFAMDDEPAAMDDQVEKPVVDDEPAAMDNEVEKPVEGGEPPVADDTPAEEGATKTTTDASGNIVYEYDTSGTTFPEDDAAALPDGDQVLDQMDAAFSIPTNIYHFWLKKMSSYDLADIAADAETAEMTVEQYLAMYGTDKGCYHIMTAADGANLKDYQFADPTSNDDPEGNSRTFAGWYYTDELGDEQKFVFDEFLYISEGTTVEVYAKWKDEAAEKTEKYKGWYNELLNASDDYTLESLVTEYFNDEGFKEYLATLSEDEYVELAQKLEIETYTDFTYEMDEDEDEYGIALLALGPGSDDNQKVVYVNGTATLKSNKGVGSSGTHQWTSSDTNIATVSSRDLSGNQTYTATVKGVRAGTVVITHTFTDYWTKEVQKDTVTLQVTDSSEDASGASSSYYLYCYTLIPGKTVNSAGTPDSVWNGMGVGSITGLGKPGQYKDKAVLDNGYGTAGVRITYPTEYPDITYGETTYKYAKTEEEKYKAGFYTITWFRVVQDGGANAGNNGYNPVINGYKTYHLDGQITLNENDIVAIDFKLKDAGKSTFDLVNPETYSRRVEKDKVLGTLENPSLRVPTEYDRVTYPPTKDFNGITYKFVGWYDNKDFTGNPVNFSSYQVTEHTTFYGKYVPKDTIVEDQPFITVEKHIKGIDESQIDENFNVIVGNHYLNKNTAKVEKKDGTIILRWTIPNAEEGTYDVSEEGETVDGYTVVTNGTGETVQTKPAETTVETVVYETKCNTTDFTVEKTDTKDFIFAAALTTNGVKKTVIISSEPLSMNVRAKIESYIRDHFSGNWKDDYKFYSVYEDGVPRTSFVIDGKEIKYDPTALKQMKLADPSDWTHVATLSYDITGGINPEIKVTNDYTPNNSDLTVAKTVTGLLGDHEMQFSFTLSFDKEVDPSKITWKKSDDSTGTLADQTCQPYTFTLAHGQNIVFQGIPAGVTATVTEESYDNYTTKYKIHNTAETFFGWSPTTESEVARVANVTIDATAKTIQFLNQNEAEPDMGVLLDTLPYILILVVVAGGGVLLFLRKRKNDDDE